MKQSELRAQLERLHAESFGWALHCSGRIRGDAEDVLQTAYLRVMSGKARFQGRSSFRTWLFGVIRRVAMETARREHSRETRVMRIVPDQVEDRETVDPQAELERGERREALLRALKELSERQREVLHLVFYQEMTIQEAGEIMGISLGSARTHYERGKRRLRSLLAEEGRNGKATAGF